MLQVVCSWGVWLSVCMTEEAQTGDRAKDVTRSHSLGWCLHLLGVLLDVVVSRQGGWNQKSRKMSGDLKDSAPCNYAGTRGRSFYFLSAMQHWTPHPRYAKRIVARGRRGLLCVFENERSVVTHSSDQAG